MATARDIIFDAFCEIGVYQPNETMTATDAQIGLGRFQKLLDAWAADRYTLAVFNPQTYVLPSGSASFTIGAGGDLNTQRPVYVDGMNYINPGSSPSVEVPMAPMSKDQYMALSIKGLSSGLPQEYFYNPTTPLGTFYVWPVPNQVISLVVYASTAIAQPATLGATVQGPPGYAEAFLYQLALRLCNAMGKSIPANLPSMASAAYLRMQRQNVEPGLLGVDAALAGYTGGGFNVLTGTFSGSSN